MNIVYYLTQFPKLSESFILNELYELDRRGHNVAVFAANNPEPNIEHEEYNELDIPVGYADIPGVSNALDLLSPKVLHPRVLKRGLFKASPMDHAGALHISKQCIEFIDRLDWDVDHVHTHFATLTRFPAVYVASHFDIPVTVTTHAYDLYSDLSDHRLTHFLKQVDHVVTISEYNKEYIQREVTDETPVSVVRAGIRPEKFDPDETTVENRLLTVGRFVEKKGIQYAIEALSTVVEEYPDVEYHIIGSGPLESEFRSRISELGLEDNVEILGKVSDERLLREFNEATFFVLPCVIDESGNRDGIPVVLMEAMAMETPPISTRVSGIPELIDHERTGLLVEPRSESQLVDVIARLLGDPETVNQLSHQCRKRVQQEFNIQHEARKLETTFEYFERK